MSTNETQESIQPRDERKPRVAFVCTHNACRSQIAEALARKLASDAFESYSAGTELKESINEDAQRIMLQLHGIDMERCGQRPKLVSEIPSPDIVVLMGCAVQCPFIACSRIENWGLEDPSGKTDEEFSKTIETIMEKVLALRDDLLAHPIEKTE